MPDMIREMELLMLFTMMTTSQGFPRFARGTTRLLFNSLIH